MKDSHSKQKVILEEGQNPSVECKCSPNSTTLWPKVMLWPEQLAMSRKGDSLRKRRRETMRASDSGDLLILFSSPPRRLRSDIFDCLPSYWSDAMMKRGLLLEPHHYRCVVLLYCIDWVWCRLSLVLVSHLFCSIDICRILALMGKDRIWSDNRKSAIDKASLSCC